MSAYANLSNDEAIELDALNNAVKQAIALRREWLDRKMLEKSDIKIGDEIYDIVSGVCLGTVTNIYRYWRDERDGIYDTSLNWDYQFRTSGPSGGIIDNTSRQPGVSFGSRRIACEFAERRLLHLKTNISVHATELGA